MRPHFHLTIDHLLATTVGVVILINVWRIGAAKLGAQPGIIGVTGRSLGALVQFGGNS